jgi:catechol 2,3-dioxygenase-like lactoylglutathione lyase family enzyme
MRSTAIAAAGLVLLILGCKGDKRSPLLEAARAAHHPELSRSIPILSVRNLHDSQHYFRDVLGFKVDWEYGNPPVFGSVSRGDAALFMCQGCQGSFGAWVMMFTPDVDKLHKELAPRGAIVRVPPTDMPWKLREMHVADRDGNVMRFASAIEH